MEICKKLEQLDNAVCERQEMNNEISRLETEILGNILNSTEICDILKMYIRMSPKMTHKITRELCEQELREQELRKV